MADFEAIAVADRLKIQEEMARYSWAIDSGDLEEYLLRFWEDGAIAHPKRDGSPGECKGRDAIRAWLSGNFEGRPTQTFGHQHQFNAVIMEPEGAYVRVRAYVMIFRHEFHRQYWPRGSSWRMGTWHTVYEQRGGTWKIRHVDVRMWTDTAFSAGTALRERVPGLPGVLD